MERLPVDAVGAHTGLHVRAEPGTGFDHDSQAPVGELVLPFGVPGSRFSADATFASAVMHVAGSHWRLTCRTEPALVALETSGAAQRAAGAVGTAADHLEIARRELRRARRELTTVVPESDWL